MGKVIMSGIVPKLTVPVIPPKNFPVGDLAVGSPVYLNVNNVPTEFIVVHKGLPSSAYDNSCNGVWLLMKDIHTLMMWGPYTQTHQAYANSLMHSYLNGDFINLFDAAVASLIKTVKIPLFRPSSSYDTGANGLSTKAFSLSAKEVGLSASSVEDYADMLD